VQCLASCLLTGVWLRGESILKTSAGSQRAPLPKTYQPASFCLYSIPSSQHVAESASNHQAAVAARQSHRCSSEVQPSHPRPHAV
jgi:hypothetical protein